MASTNTPRPATPQHTDELQPDDAAPRRPGEMVRASRAWWWEANRDTIQHDGTADDLTVTLADDDAEIVFAERRLPDHTGTPRPTLWLHAAGDAAAGLTSPAGLQVLSTWARLYDADPHSDLDELERALSAIGIHDRTPTRDPRTHRHR